MEYSKLLDMATDLGYELAMSGAETFRVEDSISRVLAAYGIQAEVFAIPNYLIVGIVTEDGTPMTRMRRIGYHGNDLDAVERYSNLSRRICAECPQPQTAMQWLEETTAGLTHYPAPIVAAGGSNSSAAVPESGTGDRPDARCSGIAYGSGQHGH